MSKEAIETSEDDGTEDNNKLRRDAHEIATSLMELSRQARLIAHNFAKSFADHPKDCRYCIDEEPTN